MASLKGLDGLSRLTRGDAAIKILDGLAREGCAAHHHFQAVVVRWVVASSDGNARAGLKQMRCEVDHRRRHLANSNDRNARRKKALTESLF